MIPQIVTIIALVRSPREIVMKFTQIYLHSVTLDVAEILLNHHLPVNVDRTNWKDPPFATGKLTISMVMFNSYV